MARATIRINSLQLTQTGTYNPMPSRPYSAHINREVLDNIVTRVQSSGSGILTPALVSGIGSQIIVPSPSHGKELIIPQGWHEPRVRFVMTVDTTTMNGANQIYYVQGYTDHLGVSASGYLDPKMMFYINSVTTVLRAQVRGPTGYHTQEVVTATYSLLEGTRGTAQDPYSEYMMRPMDMFNGISTDALRSAISDDYGPGQRIYDTRSQLGASVATTARRNNVPSNYLARVVDANLQAARGLEFGTGDENLYTRASQLASEEVVQSNTFLTALAQLNHNIAGVRKFRMGDIQSIDPNIAHVTNYTVHGQPQQLHHTGQTSHWNGSDRTTQVAVTLANAIPALMMECMIGVIHFRATNHDSFGNVSIVPYQVKLFTNAAAETFVERFKYRLQHEVLYDMTYGNQELYMLAVQADVNGDTSMTLQIGHEPPIDFVAPSFCDSIFAPVVTDNSALFSNNVANLSQMFNHINEMQPNADLSQLMAV